MRVMVVLLVALVALLPGGVEGQPTEAGAYFHGMVRNCLRGTEHWASSTPSGEGIDFNIREANFTLQRMARGDISPNRMIFALDEPGDAPLTLTLFSAPPSVFGDEARLLQWQQDASLGIGCFYWTHWGQHEPPG